MRRNRRGPMLDMDLPPPVDDSGRFQPDAPDDTEPLPPHTHDLVQCKRCGNCGADVNYEAGRSSSMMGAWGCQRDANNPQTVWGERLHRTCRRCGFYWHEAVTAASPHIPEEQQP